MEEKEKFANKENIQTELSKLKKYTDDGLNGKQNVLITGTGIILSRNEISVDTSTIQTKLTFDNTPIENSDNPVKSGGVYNSLNGKQNTLTPGDNVSIIDNVISVSTYRIQDIVSNMLGAAYTITVNVSDGSSVGNVVISNNAQVIIIPSTGYKLPSSITVTNATYTYDDTTGIINLSSPTGNVTIDVTCEQGALPYIRFYSANNFILYAGLTTGRPGWDGTMEYSTDGVNWVTWDGSSTPDSKDLYIRGTQNTYITNGMSGQNYSWHLETTSYDETPGIYSEGNIENLLDYQTVLNGNHPAAANFCFANLFSYDSNYSNPDLKSTLSLGLVSVPAYCYSSLYAQCKEIETISALPNNAIFDGYSCRKMYAKCSSVYISETQDSTYTNAYVINGGTGTEFNAFTDMFAQTGGSFIGTPTNNTTYYTSNAVVMPDGTVIQ